MPAKQFTIVKDHTEGAEYNGQWCIQNHADGKKYHTDAAGKVVAFQDWKATYAISEELNSQAVAAAKAKADAAKATVAAAAKAAVEQATQAEVATPEQPAKVEEPAKATPRKRGTRQPVAA